MECIIELLSSGAERDFFEAVNLQDVESKRDPDNEPYKSYYSAREIWHRLKSDIDRRLETSPNVFLNYMVAVLDLKLGVNYSESEEKSTGEEHLNRCVTALEQDQLATETACVLLTAFNQLGILWFDRSDPQKALSYLMQAEKLYQDFKEKSGTTPWTADDIFRLDAYNSDKVESMALTRSKNFESAHTHTFYYLAQVYTKLEQQAVAARYCRLTLSRQLEAFSYQPIDWSMNAATLSQYYIMESDFMLARHCLASAEVILKEAGKQDETSENDNEEVIDQRRKAWADLYCCWAKYGLALLEHSKERLFNELDESNNELGTPSAVSEEPKSKDDEESKERKSEKLFDLELTSIENRVTDKHVCVFDEARDVFKATQSWLEAAKMYYILDGHCSNHVELVRDHSRLYKVLAFFETSLERQCRMHKRRADMLGDLLKVLNKQFYLLVCRQLMFELAEIYSAMLDNKLAVIEESGTPPNEHARAKINSLALKSIEQFQAYVDTLRSPEGKLPDTFQEDDERPALIAHFYMGRLFSKLLDFDVPTRLKNMKKSVDSYNFLVEYCKRNPSAAAKVKSERDLCEEMVSLLPAKMEKIRALSK